MNILASYTWLKEYLKTDINSEEFAREFSLRSMSVEAIDEVKKRFANMVVGEVKELKAHPKADRLRLAITDIGGQDVQIVCGGSNLYVGQKVFVALPGSQVRWHGEGDLVELQETEIRGERSHGMICSPIEVGFDKLQGEEREIWDLTSLTQAAAGTPVVEALDLDDVIFDIEITTNRPDCMGMVGLAREAAAALGATFTAPNLALPAAPAGIDVQLNAKKLCPRYLAASLNNVKVGPSPWWLQLRLLQSGHRPINNIVDITNYVLQEYGQPLHAFDAGKVQGAIIVRPAKAGEKLVALDGKEYKLTSKHLVIADDERPLAIAGVMGGLESGTTAETTRVVFEAATFDPVSVRKTARDLNLYSDSQLVFEKGLSTEALPAALAKAIELAQALAGAELTGITDVRLDDYKPQTYPVLLKKIRARIGVEISDEEIKAILTRLGFQLTTTGSKVTATVPFWRDHDIEAEVDLTEEVARIYGYHTLPLTLPTAPPPITADDAGLVWESQLKRLLASIGYTELFGYSFVDAKTLEKYGVSPQTALKVFNPLAEDLSHLRPSLLPGLLRDIENNQAQVPRAKVFELATVYLPKTGELPEERLRLVIAHYGRDDAESEYMELKGALEFLAQRTGTKLTIAGEVDDDHWHPARRTAINLVTADSVQVVGTLGQVADTHQLAFGITKPVFALDLDLEALLPHLKLSVAYVPVPAFPVVTRDLSFVVSERAAFGELARVIKEQNVLVKAVDLVDIYRGDNIPAGKKSLTLSITFASPDRTLTSAEVDEVVISIDHALSAQFAANLRS